MKISDIHNPGNLISIDSSTNSVAFAYFNNSDLIKYGKINFAGNNVYEKIVDSCKKLSVYAKTLSVDSLVIESAIYANSQKTAIQLSLVQGSIIGAFGFSGVNKIVGVSPIQWQNWIGNKRLTQNEKDEIIKKNPNKSNSWYKSQERLFRKQRTINMVNNQFNLKVNDNDVADAIAIGWFSNANWSRISG